VSLLVLTDDNAAHLFSPPPNLSFYPSPTIKSLMEILQPLKKFKENTKSGGTFPLATSVGSQITC
jgi:hypothetical protein